MGKPNENDKSRKKGKYKPKMKKALQRKYLLDYYRQDLFLKLNQFNQDQR